MKSKYRTFVMRAFLAVVVSLGLAGSALAQMKPVTRYGEEDDPKTPAEIELQRKADAAYKRSLGTLPDARAADPWGGVRSEPVAKPAPAKKKASAPN